MNRSDLASDAISIWEAGVAAAHAGTLVRQAIRVDGFHLLLGQRDGQQKIDLRTIKRCCIVGAGKAAVAMANGLVTSLQPTFRDLGIAVFGQVNVPQSSDVAPDVIETKAVRPLSTNLPTKQTVEATATLIQRVAALDENDLCLFLISGGGSALACLPAAGVNLADKIRTIQILGDQGADIRELNVVRQCLSQVKAGGLAHACRAGAKIAFVLSDIIGDDLALIASGPTWSSDKQFRRADQIIREFDPDQRLIPAAVRGWLERQLANSPAAAPIREPIPHLLIGNTATAVSGAVAAARLLGYQVIEEVVSPPEYVSKQAQYLVQTLRESAPGTCLISGGEPTLKLAPEEIRGSGGRNQQLVLTALQMWRQTVSSRIPFCLLSAGTDGQDGNTPHPGGWCDLQTLRAIKAANVDLDDFLRRNDTGSLLQQTGNLLSPRSTHTNVCDLRVFIRGSES